MKISICFSGFINNTKTHTSKYDNNYLRRKLKEIDLFKSLNKNNDLIIDIYCYTYKEAYPPEQKLFLDKDFKIEYINEKELLNSFKKNGANNYYLKTENYNPKIFYEETKNINIDKFNKNVYADSPYRLYSLYYTVSKSINMIKSIDEYDYIIISRLDFFNEFKILDFPINNFDIIGYKKDGNFGDGLINKNLITNDFIIGKTKIMSKFKYISKQYNELFKNVIKLDITMCNEAITREFLNYNFNINKLKIGCTYDLIDFEHWKNNIWWEYFRKYSNEHSKLKKSKKFIVYVNKLLKSKEKLPWL